MLKPNAPLKVAILAVPEVTASALFGMFDLFSSPGRDFSFITHGVAGEQKMRPCIVARSTGIFNAANGIPVHPDFDFLHCPQPDIVCIPDFFVNPNESIAGQYEAESQWLKQVHGSGAMVASACSGAVLLGEAGLLNNCEATIHWGYAKMLSNYYGSVKVAPNKSLVLSGLSQRILTAGGGSSWQDLALYLIAHFVGIKEAIEVARVFMLQWHDLGQKPFASLMYFRQTQDATINRCQEWAAQNYKTPSPIAALTRLSGLSPRSFERRFKIATGMKPLDYVHALRLEEAKQMLETGDLAIEAIANETGYEDASFFSRLFRRKVGLTPAQYRMRFGILRRLLKNA
jgi:transcriptional regulator GlxA family with amidase domain